MNGGARVECLPTDAVLLGLIPGVGWVFFSFFGNLDSLAAQKTPILFGRGSTVVSILDSRPSCTGFEARATEFFQKKIPMLLYHSTAQCLYSGQ